ncbi:MAG TPA: TonB-dependent receptor [Gemmatimonadaceae bacterium]
MTFRPLLRRLVAVLAVFVAAPVAAQQTDVIRGRVTGPDNRPIEGVQVTATSVSGGVNRTARTNADGRFTITFPGGDGDYIVTMNRIGYAQRRFQVKRTADQDILVADARMNVAAQDLEGVTVQGERARVNRNSTVPDVGGTERPVNMSALSAEQQGDLAAMAASLPGVTLIPGMDGDPAGYSVLGLTQDQNNTTLNGLDFGGSNIPRDAGVMSSMVTAPYDVSRGGFSGGQMNLRTRSGTNFKMRSGSLNLDSPSLQWTDPAARDLAQQFSNISLGGGFAGPLVYDQTFYNVSYQLGRNARDFQTLLNTGPAGLQAAGVAQDSVLRLLSVLGQHHIPATTGGIPNDRLVDNGMIFGAVDWAPPSSTTGQAFNLTFSGGWNRQDPLFGGVTDLPGRSGDRTSWNGGLQARHTNFYGYFLSETSFGVSGSHSAGSPYLDLPAGSVRVNSDFEDGTSSVRSLGFGGSPIAGTSSTNLNVAFNNALSWFSMDNKHRFKLTTELRRDGYSQDQTTNRFGTFTYNSLEDLASNTPASYTRSLSPRTREGSQLVGAISLGDSYRVTNDLQLQYGVRVDGNRYGARPDRNPQIEQTFGVRNDLVPNRFYVSPRIGFSWTVGTAAQIAAFEGAVRGPRAVVRGGIGFFQNSPGTQLIGGAIDNTGLPSGVQQLTCVGSATPIPDWDLYLSSPAATPTTCADGSTGTPFANAAPNVTLFDRDYQSQKSLRSNLSWSGAILGNRFNTTIEGTYSRNMNQSSTLDLNFNPEVRFLLPDEDGRPVFVQPTSIVPTTGAIASGAGRKSNLFSRVTMQKADLTSESKQVMFRLSPMGFNTRLTWNLAYVLADVRNEFRGFSSTVGNPLDIEWGRSAFNSRHAISYGFGYNFFDVVRVNWNGSFRSGVPYTPTIVGDVNGDGYSNDRAFIFDPANTADAALASQMQQLINSSSGSARDCLLRQLGQLAGRASCTGPWTQSAVLSLSFNPVKVWMPQRTSISLQVANPLGAADLMFNGSDDLRGWGQVRTPEQSLLFVRGFDPVAQRYTYEVNQRFGATTPALTAVRAPVRVTAMIRMDLGPSREWQSLAMQLDRGRTLRGNKAPEAMLKAMYGTGGLPNPIAQILRQSDTLKLSGLQADSLATMNRSYVIRLDSIWAPIAKEFAALPDTYNKKDVQDRYVAARRASVDLLLKLSPVIKQLLTQDQLRRLPSFVASYLDPRYLAMVRSGTQGAMAPFGFPGGDMMVAPAAMGGGTVIIRQ